jgi:hypothetical protein
VLTMRCIHLCFFICLAEIAAAGSRIPQPNPLVKKTSAHSLVRAAGLSFRKSQLRQGLFAFFPR